MTLHMCKRYWQVPLSKSARELTAFCAPGELYNFMVKPFGLHGDNSPEVDGHCPER